jgi:hypothetical protein
MPYEDAAPNVSQLVDEAAFRADFPEPPAPPAEQPDPNAAQKLALYQAYRDEYAANGGAVALRRLARSVGVPYRWVEILDREIRAAMAELY